MEPKEPIKKISSSGRVSRTRLTTTPVTCFRHLQQKPHFLSYARPSLDTLLLFANRFIFDSLFSRCSTRAAKSIIVFVLLLMSATCLLATNSGFANEPFRATANLAENVILRCVFDFPEGFRVPYVIQWEKKGVKIPIYIWYDGYHPHIGEGYEGRVSLSGRASLNLTNVRETDQGWYECKVFFLNRPPEPIKNGTWVHLDVLAPPQFRVKPPDVIYVKVGESVALPCEAFGTPAPQIIWYKDNKPLKANSNIQINNQELQIDNIQSSDIGEYRCTSRNREGAINAITKIIIAGPAVITLPPRNMTKLQGDRVEFICEARALPSNVTYRWFHDGQEIGHLPWQESRFVIKPGMLVINPSVAEDSGNYMCEVSNGIGSADSASAFLNIEFPARVYYSPTIQYLPLGLSGMIRCFIQASPQFQFVTWTKDRRPFDPNSTPEVITVANGSLLFQKVSLEHQGIYRCTPYNIHGTAESSQPMQVLVRDPPIFTRKPKEIYIRAVNDEVSISCDGSGQPKPNIFWRKGDGSKLPRERTTIRSGNLTIKLLKKEDHGAYECVAENEIATISVPTILIINNTTPHTPTNVSVNTSYFAATVRWKPNYNGGYEQTFHLSYRITEQGDAEWKTIRVPPPETTNTFTLYNLQSDNEYEFQVYATNRLGAGSPSPIIKASTKPWSFGEKIYPTDASGATYIPTVQKPSGPKPDAPRNLTFQRMAQGWVLSWLSPINISVAVAYYRVEHRRDQESWVYTDPIPYDTAYLFEKLEPNSRYIFRVWAYSILGVGEVSPMIEVNIDDFGDSPQLHFRAMIVSIIGGFIFFSLSILLTLCVVKVCNKKKRRKIEKSYVMVTCPVNGTTCYSDNSVPSKQYFSRGHRFFRQQYHNDEYYRNYWQRPTFGARATTNFENDPMAKRFGTQNLLPVWRQHDDHEQTIGYHQRSQEPPTGAIFADIHYDDAQYWPIRDANLSATPIWSCGESFDDGQPPSLQSLSIARRRPMNHFDSSMPFQKISLIPAQKIKSMDESMNKILAPSLDRAPSSNQPSIRGSFRSDGSGQSQVCRPFSQLSFAGSVSNRNPMLDGELGLIKNTLNQSDLLATYPHHHPQYHYQQKSQFLTPFSPIYLPEDGKQSRTQSPQVFNSRGNFNKNHFPSFTINSLMTDRSKSEQQKMSESSQLGELPALRPIHEGTFQQPSFQRAHLDGSLAPLRATIPMSRSVPYFTTRTLLSKRPKLEPVPEAIYDSIARTETISKNKNEPKSYNPYQNLPIPRHLLNQTLGPKPSKFVPKNTKHYIEVNPESLQNTSSSNSSMEQQFEYTRDKLLGAVEKVRSGYFLLNRASPYRHSIDGRISSHPTKQISQAIVVRNQNAAPCQPHCKTSDQSTSYSSQISYSQSHIPPSSPSEVLQQKSSTKFPWFSSLHYRDNLMHLNYISNDTATKSIHSSKITQLFDSAQQNSNVLAEESSLIRPPRSSTKRSTTVSLTSPSATSLPMSMMTNAVRRHSQQSDMIDISEYLDISVDENYEFDDKESEPNRGRFNLIEYGRLSSQHHQQLTTNEQNIQRNIGMYGKSSAAPLPSLIRRSPQQSYSYRAPRNMCFNDMETRCAALRREFLHFRQRQRQRQAQVKQQQTTSFLPQVSTTDMTSSSSDGLESIC